MSVDAEFASWLSSQCLYAVATSAGLKDAWGDLAATAELVTVLALKADAEAEAARQIDLFGAAMVVEVLQVAGLRIDLFARPVALTADRAGYADGVTVFVLAVKELDKVERTNLTVLRKLT